MSCLGAGNADCKVAHHTALFLPWHRYYIQVYLNILRTRCGYTGDLVYMRSFILITLNITAGLTGIRYWDWILDFANSSTSLIFDPDHGFGGDGTLDEPENESKGTCIHNGPFAHYYALYVDSKYAPHCLSCRFGEKFFVQHPLQSPFHPERVNKMLALPNFEEFTTSMYQMHNDLHNRIGGDLQYNTSPYGNILCTPI